METISRLNPIVEALRSNPKRVHKIFIQKEARNKKISQIIWLAHEHHIPFLFVPRQKLDSIDKNHQGAVAMLSPKEFSSLESILKVSEQPFLLLLDGVEDPQNFGAIVRNAEGGGVDGIVIPERHSVGLTSTVASVSAGALEHIKIARIKNLAQTADMLKERGIWIIGAEEGSSSYWYEFDYTQPVAIVLGSEGKGLRPLIKKKCDKILSLPHFGKVSSLNVASAASIFIYEVIRQRMSRM